MLTCEEFFFPTMPTLDFDGAKTTEKVEKSQWTEFCTEMVSQVKRMW